MLVRLVVGVFTGDLLLLLEVGGVGKMVLWISYL